MQDTLTHSQIERFKLIERYLLWAQQLKAKSIVDEFGISRYQAGLDIKAYMERCPNNILPYVPADKCYKPSPQFVPQLITEDPVEVLGLGETVLVQGAPIASVPVLERRVLPGVIPTLLRAIGESKSIRAIYASTSNPVGRVREITPVRLIYAANRLHVRAFCHERNEYRDFALSRFLNKPKIGRQVNDLNIDQSWEEFDELAIVPNPKLDESSQRLVCEEYQIKGKKIINTRKALVHYFLIFNNIPHSKEQLEMSCRNPWAYPLTLSNINNLKGYFFNEE